MPANRKYQTYRMTGVPFIGSNPMLYEPSPEIFIIRANSRGIDKMSPEERKIFFEKYNFLETVGRYDIFIKI